MRFFLLQADDGELGFLRSWFDWLSELFASLLGIGESWGGAIARTLLVIFVVAVAIALHKLARLAARKGLAKLVVKTRSRLDDLIVESKVFERVAMIVPAIFVWYAIGAVFFEETGASASVRELVRRVAIAYMFLIGSLTLGSLINAIVSVYQTLVESEYTPFLGFVRIVKTALYIVAAILIVSELIGSDPWTFLTGLGAMTAIVMLVFKDTILGFVATIQVATKDLVRTGDWIEFPKYGADGDVIDISLNTVRVQNWDKTISTIPTYALVSESFRNWRGMKDSGGRRIKRSVQVDMNTVRFLAPEEIEAMKRFVLIRDYLEERVGEIETWNREHGFDADEAAGARRLTNIGTFRRYVIEYLREHDKIHDDMTLLVRQLQPTEHGVPIEIYCFSSDQVWANYEGIQADIFDHLLALLPEFDLRAFQTPSGQDVRAAITSWAELARPRGEGESEGAAG